LKAYLFLLLFVLPCFAGALLAFLGYRGYACVMIAFTALMLGLLTPRKRVP
jgi:hypothetical protein